MSVLHTRIYEYKIWLGNLMDYVTGEQARRVYVPGADRETEASAAYAYMMTEDDVHWFRTYLERGLAEVCTVLQPLQKYLDEPFQMDPLMATLRFRLSPLYQTSLLESEVLSALGNYVCYRWFSMKGLADAAALYKQLYDESRVALKGFGVRGIHGRSVAYRPYDIGLGSFRPVPYEEKDILIRDLRWNTSGSCFDDLYGKGCADGGPVSLPGVTVVGNPCPEAQGEGGPCMEGDKGMVIGGIPEHEVITRQFNVTRRR